MKNKALVILLALIFLKGIIWMVATPIFQVPDESSHFSRIQVISETGKQPHPRRIKPTSQEVLKVSDIINFDWDVNHPMWQGYSSNWRQQLELIPLANRNIFIHNPQQTSSKRPPLYYWLATPFYLVVSQKPFLIRFFSVRLFSVFIHIITVYIVFLLAQLFFKEKLLPIAAAALVAFQPMFSFINIGVHYDPLTILIASLFLYKALIYLKSKKKKHLYQAFLTALLGIFINPILICLILTSIFLIPKKKIKIVISLGLIFFIIFIFMPKFLNLVILKYNFLDSFMYLVNLNEYGENVNFFYQVLFSGQIFSQFKVYLTSTFNIHLAQVFPWYWGVFGWLEKTLPLMVYKIIKLAILISFIGWIKLIISQLVKHAIPVIKLKSLSLLIIASMINLSIVVLNDFRAFTRTGASFGIQGRYLLPMISSHMILLVFGLTQLVPRKHQSSLAKLLIISSLVLNLIGLNALYQYFGWVWS